jgi:hypothetical protein
LPHARIAVGERRRERRDRFRVVAPAEPLGRGGALLRIAVVGERLELLLAPAFLDLVGVGLDAEDIDRERQLRGERHGGDQQTGHGTPPASNATPQTAVRTGPAG